MLEAKPMVTPFDWYLGFLMFRFKGINCVSSLRLIWVTLGSCDSTTSIRRTIFLFFPLFIVIGFQIIVIIVNVFEIVWLDRFFIDIKLIARWDLYLWLLTPELLLMSMLQMEEFCDFSSGIEFRSMLVSLNPVVFVIYLITKQRIVKKVTFVVGVLKILWYSEKVVVFVHDFLRWNQVLYFLVALKLLLLLCRFGRRIEINKLLGAFFLPEFKGQLFQLPLRLGATTLIAEWCTDRLLSMVNYQ